MANEFAKARLAELKAAFNDQVALIADLQQRRALLTGTGTARGERVRVTVNAEGTVIETKFTTDISDLSYSDIAHAMTEAAQRASAEVARKRAELMRPIAQVRDQLPKMHEIVENMPDVTSRLPKAPEVSLAPPNSPERLAAEHDALPHTEHRARRNGDGLTETCWSPTLSEMPRATLDPYTVGPERTSRTGGSVTEAGWSSDDDVPDSVAYPDTEETTRSRGDIKEFGW